MRATVERLLSQVWEGPVRIARTETLREGKVFRVVLDQVPTGSPVSVLVKRAVDEPGIPVDPDSTEGNPAQLLLEEWAGLQFLENLDTAPRFYAGDRADCLVVFEDLGPGETLVGALRGSDPVLARARLNDHAKALATLHGATAGREREYREIRDALGPPGTPRDWKRYGIVLDTQGWGDLRAIRPDLELAFARLEQNPPLSFWREYEELRETVEAPSPFRTYVHSDSCPDNVLFTPDGAHLIDFERGGFHLCLLDVAYCRMSMPHCFWAGRVPREVTRSVEATYRQHLTTAIPQIGDDRTFGRAMTAACAYWILSNGTWLVHRGFDEDFAWGPATWRQRVFLRLEQFAATAEEFGAFPALGAAARETISRLRTHWEFQAVPVFPAFAH